MSYVVLIIVMCKIVVCLHAPKLFYIYNESKQLECSHTVRYFNPTSSMLYIVYANLWCTIFSDSTTHDFQYSFIQYTSISQEATSLRLLIYF